FVTAREAAAIEPLAPEKKEGKKEEKKEEKKDEKADQGKGSEGGGKPAESQLWLISAAGGEAWQITKSETDIEGFAWSKDSKHIDFTANDPEAKSTKDRKEKFSDYDVYEKDFRQSQLWLVDIAAAAQDSLPVAATKLTSDNSLNITDFSWSPDSTRIAF